MKPKQFPTLILAVIFLVLADLGSAQLAPAGVGAVQAVPGEYFYFNSEGTFTYGSSFTDINFNTGESDFILTNVAANGSFSGVSPTTGRSVMGQILASSITITYNGITASAPKLSSYGPTRQFAGNWLGVYEDPVLGVGALHFGISSQGGVLTTTYLGSSVDHGVGTIDASGNYSVTLLNGVTLTGQFTPTYGRALGFVSSSLGQTGPYAAVRAVPSRLENISTRGFVGTGDQVLIGGFIIKGGGKTVFIDAKGPSLSGVSDPVEATQLTLYFGSEVIASNNGWRNNANVGEIEASGLAPTDDRESALQVALEPGAYTVVVSSGNGSTGIGLVEVYGVGDTVGP